MAKKTLFILMPEDYRDEEFSIPYNEIKAAGYTVDVAGFNTGVARGVNGHEHIPNLHVDSLINENIKHYDALVIPGGPGSITYLWGNPRVQEIIRFFHEHKKMVAAICYACIAVAESGILKSKEATVYPTDETKGIFKKMGIKFKDDGCVIIDDGKIITAQGPKFAKEFAQAILVNV